MLEIHVCRPDPENPSESFPLLRTIATDDSEKLARMRDLLKTHLDPERFTIRTAPSSTPNHPFNGTVSVKITDSHGAELIEFQHLVDYTLAPEMMDKWKRVELLTQRFAEPEFQVFTKQVSAVGVHDWERIHPAT